MQEVPQFINTQDKIAGPFTWQQLAWLGGAGLILALLWQLLIRPVFFVAAAPIVIMAGLLTFFRPYEMSFIAYLGHVVTYFIKPRTYLWQREVVTHEDIEDQPQEVQHIQKSVSLEDVQALTQALDSHGTVRNERLQAIISQNLTRSAHKNRLGFGHKKKSSSQQKK